MLSAHVTHLEGKYFPNPHLFFSKALVYSLINGSDLIVPRHAALSAASD